MAIREQSPESSIEDQLQEAERQLAIYATMLERINNAVSDAETALSGYYRSMQCQLTTRL